MTMMNNISRAEKIRILKLAAAGKLTPEDLPPSSYLVRLDLGDGNIVKNHVNLLVWPLRGPVSVTLNLDA